MTTNTDSLHITGGFIKNKEKHKQTTIKAQLESPMTLFLFFRCRAASNQAQKMKGNANGKAC